MWIQIVLFSIGNAAQIMDHQCLLKEKDNYLNL